jgi:hypothetical protein
MDEFKQEFVSIDLEQTEKSQQLNVEVLSVFVILIHKTGKAIAP